MTKMTAWPRGLSCLFQLKPFRRFAGIISRSGKSMLVILQYLKTLTMITLPRGFKFTILT